MTERINTTAAMGQSETWALTSGTVIQVAGSEGSTATVELWARVDAAAPFSYIASARVASEAFIAAEANFYEGQLVWHSNREGDNLMAWSMA